MNDKMKQSVKIQNQMKQCLITDYFNKKRKFMNDTEVTNDIDDIKDKKIKVYGYNYETDCWHCLECGDDMGPNNPRQLCGKYFCHNR